ncbi:ATP-binding protein [Paenibacillus thermoaerophilus]|uniref:histidine kinase n=1 Tax=Paenibacillus thermoaerophilus TaxID=1215385 RepID=A0ABW2V8F7_9BACL|nr:ATP-binding protein [Paenibacillus thermoaerophilus]TMV07514.1 cell wall metabolism sensor histidine kinase WalK [Paenibacillus thermoaerophilus]
MKFLKSVVGKLWMTIIGLVALVLLINSLLLSRFIDTNLISPKDQERTLQEMARKISAEIPRHRELPYYVVLVNEILGAQEAGLIVYDASLNPVQQDTQAGLEGSNFFGEKELRDALVGLEQFSQYEAPDGKEYLAYAVPIRETAGSAAPPEGVAVVYQKKIALNYIQQYYTKLFAIAVVIGFLLTTFFAFFLSTRITQPLLRLKRGADAITKGEYSIRQPVSSEDEIGELTKAFNLMAERLELTIQDLRHEKENLSGILRSMADAVVTVGADGRPILTNPHGEEVLRTWRSLDWESDGKGGLPEPLAALFEQAMTEQKEVTDKVHVLSSVWSVVIAPLYSNEPDGVRGAVAVLRDVTEEHRLDKLRKDFVANVSHELRTPISMLQGYSEALLDDIADSPEERKQIAQIIYDESLRMGRLVQDLLDLARMEAGHMEFKFDRLQVAKLLERIHRKFAVYGKDNQVRLQLEVPDEPMSLERADEDRLEQVFTNLLDNAIRHTPEGKTIRLSASPATLNGVPAVRFEVADEGHGIPPEDLPFVFERFYKADKARTRGSSGTGLGLSIVKNIVESHGGTVSVSSTPSVGTTFTVILPGRT